MKSISTRVVSLALALTFLCIILASCANKHTVEPAEPVVVPQAETAAEAEPFVDYLKNRIGLHGIKTLKSEVMVEVYKGGEREGVFKGVLAYSAPESLRLRMLSQMGITVMDMLIKEGKMQVHVPPKNILYEGDALPLGAPKDAMYGLETVDEEHYTLYAFKQGGMEGMGGEITLTGKYTFSGLDLKNDSILIFREARRHAGIMLEDYAGGVPMTITLVFSNGFGMKMKLSEPEVDKAIPEKYFKNVSPEGKEVKQLQTLLREREPNK